MITNKFFLRLLPIIAVACPYLFTESNAIAAGRVAIGGTSPSKVRPTVSNNIANITATGAEESSIVLADIKTIETPAPVYNKSEKFATTLSNSVNNTSSSDAELAEMIKKQREKILAQDTMEMVEKQMKDGLINSINACDDGLRKCMAEKCGADFTQCALDGDTIFGDKINSCKRNLKCTGEEIRLFSAEIKADRDANVYMAAFDKVVECGKAYNYCMLTNCGLPVPSIFASDSDLLEIAIHGKKQESGFNKCLNAVAANTATRTCKAIADKCMESDSGLAGRFGIIIGQLREDAEIQVAKDEKRLTDIHDAIKESCERLGANFDERTFDCVYTIEFFAGESQHPMATQKRYAGDTFVCTPEWFGIDVTTYKENAYRETRAQTGASSAFMGAGIGTAVGQITSGAIGRAIKTKQAKDAAAAAKPTNTTGGSDSAIQAPDFGIKAPPAQQEKSPLEQVGVKGVSLVKNGDKSSLTADVNKVLGTFPLGNTDNVSNTTLSDSKILQSTEKNVGDTIINDPYRQSMPDGYQPKKATR